MSIEHTLYALVKAQEGYRVILRTPHRLAIAVSQKCQKGVKLSWEDALADLY